MPASTAWLLLVIAVVAEVIGTSALKASDGFTRVLPSAVAVGSYGVALLCLALAMRVIPIGLAYAAWAGLGTALIAVTGWLCFGQQLSPLSLLGIGLVMLGVALIHMGLSA